MTADETPGEPAEPAEAAESEPRVVERVRVWIDRPRDQICVVDRLDERVAEADGKPIPDDCIIRIPLIEAEDFVDAVFNALVGKVDGEDFTRAFYGVQKILDRRASAAVQVAERLRLEMAKRSGGSVDRNLNETLVPLDVLTRLRGLRDVVAAQALRVDSGETPGEEAFGIIWDHFVETRMAEA
ncbi:MAG TPA: hypothetical protein VMZ50_06210 [Phycisphaerae bacterium]|nr:hypothetical protein [Phycisphaerae bacterium]